MNTTSNPTLDPVQSLIDQVNSTVMLAKEAKGDPARRLQAGQQLATEATPLIAQLQAALGDTAPQFTTLCDKVANEILSCAIDYFNGTSELDTPDKSLQALALQKQAAGLAKGTIAQQRAQENGQIFQAGADNLPKRDIIYEVALLKTLEMQFSRPPLSVEGAKSLIEQAQPALDKIRAARGADSTDFRQAASGITEKALSNMVADINDQQAAYNAASKSEQPKRLETLLRTMEQAVEITNQLDALAMTPATRAYFDRNKAKLAQILQRYREADITPLSPTRKLIFGIILFVLLVIIFLCASILR